MTTADLLSLPPLGRLLAAYAVRLLTNGWTPETDDAGDVVFIKRGREIALCPHDGDGHIMYYRNRLH